MIFPRVGLTGRCLQYFAFGAGALNIISCGLHLGWPAPYLPDLLDGDSPIPTTDDEGSWVAVSLLIGSIFGALFAAAFLDTLGRRKLILISTVPIFTSWLQIAYASTVWELCVARFIAGLSDGITLCALPLYFAEMSDAGIRGIFLSGITVIYLLGVLLVYFIGTVMSIPNMAFVGAVVPVFVFATFSLLPETPHFQLIKGDVEMARSSLQQFSGKSNVDEQVATILNSLTKSGTSQSKCRELFSSSSSRKAFGISFGLRGVQAWSGAMAFTFYLPTILEDAVEFVSPLTSIVIYYILQILFLVLSMIAVDRVGRKPLLLFSAIVVSASLILVSAYFAIQNLTNVDVSSVAWIPLAGLLVFIVGCSSGLNGIPLLLVGELFPIGVKSWAICILDMYFCAMSALAAKFLQYTKDGFGMHVPFLTFATCCMCGIPFVIFGVPETKSKTLEEIQECLLSNRERNSLHQLS